MLLSVFLILIAAICVQFYINGKLHRRIERLERFVLGQSEIFVDLTPAKRTVREVRYMRHGDA